MENELRQPFQTGNTAVTSYRGTCRWGSTMHGTQCGTEGYINLH